MAGSTCHQLSGLSQYLNGAEAFFFLLFVVDSKNGSALFPSKPQ